MAQAKNRLAKMIANHPNCCLCGGEAPTESIEHAPPKIMFWEKRRPKGLEVPACRRCNNDTSKIDQLAAFYAITQSHRNLRKLNPAEEKYFDKVSRGCVNNFPDMIEMFKIGSYVDEKYGSIVFDNQKLFVEKLNAWAAKQSLAHWFILSKYKIFPPQGIVGVRWLTNVEASIDNKFITLVEKLPHSSELKMGEWQVNDQFFVRYSLNIDENIGAMFVRYHGTGFIAALVGNEAKLKPSMKLIGGYGATFKTNKDKGIYEYKK